MDDDQFDEYDSEDIEDIEDIEEKELAALRAGKLIVKNSEGTLRCPYSPSRKKQAYPYKDLLQHAEGVAKGKRGPEAAGKHRALTKYLLTDLKAMATPPVERVQKLELIAPQRKDAEDLLVYPWSGVVYNIDNHTRSKGLFVGIGGAEIKQHFAVFSLEKVNVLWGPKGHLGMAVVTFRRGLEGLKDAQAFEKWFIGHEHGRRDWERKRRDGLGSKLYGWLARKADHEGRREVKDDYKVAECLQGIGDLMDVGMVGEEQRKIQEQRFNTLAEHMSEKSKDYRNLQTEVEVARRNAEVVKRELEEKHKQELEEVKKKAEQSTEEHAKVMQARNQRLQESMGSLEKRCKELEVKEQQAKNDADRHRLEQEKNQNRWQLDLVNQQKDMQQRYKTDQVKLIRLHEEQNKKLEIWIQDRKLKLANQHEKEIEVLRLGEMIDSEKFEEMVEGLSNSDNEGGSNKELEEKLKAMEDQKVEFEEKLEDLKEENDMYTGTINALTQQQRTANDELEAARHVSIKALTKYGSDVLGVKRMGEIGVKKMGEIDEGPWKTAFRKRHKNLDAGLAQKQEYSKWEDLVKDHNFNPFKNVKIGDDDKWERQIDDNDERLRALKSELGDEVCSSVCNALREIEEYNASGRYPVPTIWNFKANKRATLVEVIDCLMKALAATAPVKKRKRTAANRS